MIFSLFLSTVSSAYAYVWLLSPGPTSAQYASGIRAAVLSLRSDNAESLYSIRCCEFKAVSVDYILIRPIVQDIEFNYIVSGITPLFDHVVATPTSLGAHGYYYADHYASLCSWHHPKFCIIFTRFQWHIATRVDRFRSVLVRYVTIQPTSKAFAMRMKWAILIESCYNTIVCWHVPYIRSIPCSKMNLFISLHPIRIWKDIGHEITLITTKVKRLTACLGCTLLGQSRHGTLLHITHGGDLWLNWLI